MKKKSIIRNGIICTGLLLAVFACREKWPETVIWTDTSSLPDTLYQNPVFEPVLADPTVIQTGDGTFYAYGTEDSWDKDTHHIVAIIKSKDLVKWTYVSDAFTATSKPSWGTANAGVWAPQIIQSQKDGRYYLYYSLSTWGDPNPGIGVAVADSPEGPFTDLGQILRSNEIGVANSIDPFFTSIKKGSRYTYYLFWGSFNGIYCIQMQDETTIYPGAKPTMIANNLYEASYIYQYDGKFYFFGSMGSCCEGRDSQYRVKVAKADNILGPYLNDLGQDIKTNGVEGKAFLTGDADLGFVGPGHNAEIIQDKKGRYFILYHAVDILSGEGDGTLAPGSTATRRPLMLDEITWVDGWPVVNYGTDLEGKPSNILKQSPVFEEEE